MLTAAELTDLLKSLFSYKHYIFYYGAESPDDAAELLKQNHETQGELKEYPKAKKFEQLPLPAKNRVYFVDYDMVQSQIAMLSRDEKFDKKMIPYVKLYNKYFGNGLSSIVFQEMRESRALAYSAAAWISTPSRKERFFSVNAFVATQSDKLEDAVNAMSELMNNMPKAEMQFETAKLAIMKEIETERIIKTGIFWTYLENSDRGLDYDVREDIYKKMKTLTMDEFYGFFTEHVNGKKYIFIVMGGKNNLNIDALKKLGEFNELTLKDVFGF